MEKEITINGIVYIPKPEATVGVMALVMALVFVMVLPVIMAIKNNHNLNIIKKENLI